MRTFIYRFIVIILAASTAACVGAAQYGARRIVKEVRGIKYDAIEAVPVTSSGTYDSLVIEPLENQMEDAIPAEFVSSLNDELYKHVSKVKRLQVVKARQPGSEKEDVPPAAGDAVASVTPSMAPPPLSNSLLPKTGSAQSAPSSQPQVTRAVSQSRAVILHGAIVDYHPGNQSLRVLQIGVGREAVLTLHLWFVDAATGKELGKYVLDSEVYRLGGDTKATIEKVSKGVGELVAKVVQDKFSKQRRPGSLETRSVQTALTTTGQSKQ